MPILAGHQGLPSILQRLARIVKHEYPKFMPISLPLPLPIIDLTLLNNPLDHDREDLDNRTNHIFGLAKLYGEMRRECDRIEKFVRSNKGWELLPPLSTNAPYLIAVWDELIASHGAIAVGKMFPLPKTTNTTHSPLPNWEMLGVSNESVKVDVVSESGRKWTRIITLTASRFIRELDEIESSDSDSGSPSALGGTSFSRLPESSLVTQGRKYVLAANFESKRIPWAGSTSPEIHFRLTRLASGHSSHGKSSNVSIEEERDIMLSRILKHVAQLNALGITVLLDGLNSHGERLANMEIVKSPISFHPTMKINLDLSAVIALCSEITHMVPPENPSVAEERFRPWQQLRVGACPAEHERQGGGGELPEDLDGCSVEHARSLISQSIQEAKMALLGGIRNKIMEGIFIGSGQLLLLPSYGIMGPNPCVEFWTTPEVQRRAFGILEKIGGDKERARARALFNSSSDEHESFWLHSCYPRDFIPSLYIRLFPSDIPSPCTFRSLVDDVSGQTSKCSAQSNHTSESNREREFWTHLGGTAASLAGLHSQALPVSPLRKADTPGSHQNPVRSHIMRHTALSFLWGSHMQMTTITANRTSVRTLMREMNTIARPGALQNPLVSESVIGREVGEKAVIWIIPPRSLAEMSISRLSPPFPDPS